MILEHLGHRPKQFTDQLRKRRIGRKSLTARRGLFIHPTIVATVNLKAQA
jgi:hypothetical protein